MKNRALLLVFAPTLLFACNDVSGTSAGEGSSSTTAGADELDVRVEVPTPDDRYFDIVTPEVVIEPGEEKMYCLSTTYTGEDTALRNMESYQGKFGHHLVILTSKEPQPDGTLEDCTTAQDMAKYKALVLPSTPLPAGHGIMMKKGTPIVLQFHYVNAGAQPIRIRDVARLDRLPLADVTTWVATATTSHLGMAVPAGEETVLSFDCVAPEDFGLMIVGGHMHEQGSRFEFQLGQDEASLESVYLVDPWRTEYRDAPPVTERIDDPIPVKAGDIFRTTCTWKSTADHMIGFPEEMCSTFGYVAGTQNPWDCRVE